MGLHDCILVMYLTNETFLFFFFPQFVSYCEGQLSDAPSSLSFIKGIFLLKTSSLHIIFHRISLVSFQSSSSIPTVFPILNYWLPDAPSPVPSIKGILFHQTSFLHIIFHLISPSNSLFFSRSSSSNRFSPTPLHHLHAIHLQHMSPPSQSLYSLLNTNHATTNGNCEERFWNNCQI